MPAATSMCSTNGSEARRSDLSKLPMSLIVFRAAAMRIHANADFRASADFPRDAAVQSVAGEDQRLLITDKPYCNHAVIQLRYLL